MINTDDMKETLEWNGTEKTINLLINAIDELQDRVRELENLTNENLVDVEMKLDCQSRDIEKNNQKITEYIN